MKQLTIDIKDVKNNSSYGIKNITQLNWDRNGLLYCIEVDFMGNDIDNMVMYRDINADGIYYNQHKNLMCVL